MALNEGAIPNGFVLDPVAGSINPPPMKKKRNLPGNPDPEAEVIALSPNTLMATNRFLCEICGKGFQRDQNLQLHRRGHNLPWKLKQRTSKEPRKRVFVCPEKSCVHHHPCRALGDLTGIKKHFCRKHGEKKWKCDKCSKRYAVQSDWKAHSKTCGTREYRCDCGTLFSRRDSFITHRAFCDALAEEAARINAVSNMNNNISMAGNISYQYTGNSLLAGPNNMAQQYCSSIFKPISSNIDAAMSQTTTQGLSLWMGQGSQGDPEAMSNNNTNINTNHDGHQDRRLGSSVSSARGTIFVDHDHHPHLVLCSERPPQSDQQLNNWVLGNKLAPYSTINAHAAHQESTTTTTSSSVLPLISNIINVASNKEYGTGSHRMGNIVPSLYSTSIHQNTPSANNLSATALLQKAAQIGATSSDAPLLESFGLKCNNNNTTTGQVLQDGIYSKVCGLYGTSSSAMLFNNIISTSSTATTTTHQNQDQGHRYIDLQMNHHAKRRHIQSSSDYQETSAGGVGHTRDFLGVGVDTICHSSSSIDRYWI